MSSSDKHSATSRPLLSRRQFIATVGGGVILAAGAGLAGFSLTRTPKAALAPWAEAGQFAEPRRFALSYAILAPNPHNLQPWMVDLSEPDMVTLLADPDRRLPETDPFDRQLTIGLGGFLELMRIAASAQGYDIDVTLFPDGADSQLISARPVAKVRFRPGQVQPDPLFNFVSSRRSTKEPFDMGKAVNDSNIVALSQAVAGVRFAGTRSPEQVARLRELIWNAFQVEYETPATLQESIDLMRFGKTAINATPDGIDIGGMPLEGLQRLGLISPGDLATPGTLAYQTGLNMYQDMFAATPAFVWLTTADNSRESQIAAGQAWLRLNLTTTQQGMALHPVSQCLQEYPQMQTHYQRGHQLLANDGETVQMLGRLGYAAAVPPTPRWSLDEKIRVT
ncbi:Acg family FMN-binding oxidoreductase [Pseudohongiella sp.]|uniref:Twin-arginine translocation pathway signal protein n=1 Tax=marine sediment metagenome TaxID=412755 RepID=A0A0F9YKW1_9ZZZZ|nr:twin-arginine translocation pathway signal protein [Pseudohongiella sp.]HDZ09507.1 twin-arginine translocation pathway signal protein [Pseudohongiella sp.]HEA63921.1 twin-arginine translocation pathway signal protein [Pseudohongiella sp.]